MIIRGTTPTLIFNLPFPASTMAAFYINISQRYENVQIEKAAEDCVVSDSSITLVLTQEDTLKLIPDKQAFIQIRVRTNDGTALASKVFASAVGDVLKEGVI